MHSVLHNSSGRDEMMCSDDNDEGGEDLLDFDSLFDKMMEEKDLLGSAILPPNHIPEWNLMFPYMSFHVFSFCF